MYEDDKDTYGYEAGNFSLAKFELNGSENTWVINQTIEGSYQRSFSQYEIQLVGLPFTIQEVLVDGEMVEFTDQHALKLSSSFKNLEIKG